MKMFSAWVALFATAGFLAADEPKNEWVKSAPKGGKCEILFPAMPKEMSGAGQIQVILEREGGKVALMLQFNDLPKAVDVGSADDVKKVMNGGRDALKNAFKGAKIVSEKELTIDKKFPARDIDMEIPALGIYHVRFILTGPKFYQVTVLGPKDYQTGPEAKKFLGSFRFKD